MYGKLPTRITLYFSVNHQQPELDLKPKSLNFQFSESAPKLESLQKLPNFTALDIISSSFY